jgi:hypothetical protein
MVSTQGFYSALKRNLMVGLVVSVFLSGACSSIGPKSIPRDHLDYGAALIKSTEEQLLMNMVRLRYREAPVFLNVASVINQYSLEGQVSAGLGFGSSFTGGDSQSLGASGRWADRPTITYSPVSGQQFSRNLLSPLPPTALFALVQSGWPVDLVFRVTVASINDVENERPSARAQRIADPQFLPLLKAWGRLIEARVLGMRQVEHEKGTAVVAFIYAENLTPDVADDLNFVKEVLGLDPTHDEFTLRYGLIPNSSSEIAVLTNSVLEIMLALGWYFDVPPEHVSEGRTSPSFTEEDGSMKPMIRVHYAKERPKDAVVAVKSRDYWFYIDDRDMLSKTTFAFVQIILSLAETDAKAVGPVVSIGG